MYDICVDLRIYRLGGVTVLTSAECTIWVSAAKEIHPQAKDKRKRENTCGDIRVG